MLPSALLIGPCTAAAKSALSVSHQIVEWDFPLGIDIREPWDFSQKFDYIQSSYWPQEQVAQQEFLARLGKILQPNGQLQITRHFFEKTFNYDELANLVPKNNWLLTSTLLALPTPPAVCRLHIRDLKDPYPLKARFLSAIIAGMERECAKIFPYVINETNSLVTLQSDNEEQIIMQLDLVGKSFTATITPGHPAIFNKLAKLSIATFVNDIASFSETYIDGIWSQEIEAKS